MHGTAGLDNISMSKNFVESVVIRTGGCASDVRDGCDGALCVVGSEVGGLCSAQNQPIAMTRSLL